MQIRRVLLSLDGRWIAAGIVVAFWMALYVTSILAAKPVFELPPFTTFGPMAPYFADLRGVVSWSDQFYAGHTTLNDLRDPWNRPLNYPFWWLYIHNLGVNTGNVMSVGYGINALFLIAAFYVLGRLNALGGLIAGLFLISYAVMFGMERANVDLLIFCLLAMALACRRIPPATALTLSLAAILKLHPLFAFVALLTPRWKKSLPWICGGLLLFFLGISYRSSEFASVFTRAPNMHSGLLSFGMTSLGLEIVDWYNRPGLYGMVIVFGVTLLILAAGTAAWIRPSPTFVPQDERTLFAFRLGAGLYTGSYLLGTNHDYRLVFLLFCLPLLLRLLDRDGTARRWAIATLALIFVSVNWLYLSGDGNFPQFLFKQGAAWALFICLTGFLIATLPPELQWPRRPQPAAVASPLIFDAVDAEPQLLQHRTNRRRSVPL